MGGGGEQQKEFIRLRNEGTKEMRQACYMWQASSPSHVLPSFPQHDKLSWTRKKAQVEPEERGNNNLRTERTQTLIRGGGESIDKGTSCTLSYPVVRVIPTVSSSLALALTPMLPLHFSASCFRFCSSSREMSTAWRSKVTK